MIFVFDLDDTVCDTDAYSEKYILDFINKNNLPYNFIKKEARFAEMKFDWSETEALKWYKTYGDQMMLEFPAKPEALETINALFDAGHTIIIATARATDWHTNPIEITYEWLKQNNVKYTKIYTGRVDKEAICLDEKADFFIDDDIKITGRVALTTHISTTFNEKGCKPLLMSTNYNKTLEVPNGVTRIKDFKHFKEYLKELNVKF